MITATAPIAHAQKISETTVKSECKLASFGAIGVSDFVIDWPDEADLDTFEAVVRDVVPALREGV